MIDNDYVYELDIELNFEYLRMLVLNSQTAPGEYPYRRIVSNSTYMQSLYLRFHCLADRFNIYSVPPGGTLPLHIDAGRSCALNIPILNTNKSDTIFYKPVEDVKTARHDLYYDAVTSKVEETFRFSLTTPAIINNTVPHRVINYGLTTRVIISWSVIPSMTFDRARDLFKQILAT